MEANILEEIIQGEGSFRVKPSGKIEFRISYKDEFGKRKMKGFTGDTEDECIERARVFFQKLAKQREGFSVDSTITDIARHKVETDYKKNFTGEQGYCRNQHTLQVIERSNIGHIPVSEIEEKHLDLFLQSITRYSNTMISKIYSMVRSAFTIAFDSRLVEKNYMLSPNLRCPKSDRDDKKVRGLTEEEQKAFLDALDNHEGPKNKNSYKLQLLVELYGGLRMGEVNALRPEDIDFEKGILKIERTVSRGINYREFIKEGTKTYAGRREVPLNNRLRTVLEEALSKMEENPEGTLFYDFNKGDIVSTSQVNCFYRRICGKANIEYSGQHALRHTFATRCIEAGIPAVVLKKWLGHTNIHVTLDTYADVFSRMNFDSMVKFDTLMDEVYDDPKGNEDGGLFGGLDE